MPYIKVEDFSGTVPRTGPTQIEANQAQLARNVKLQSRELRSWSLPVLEYVPTTPNVQTIYRIDSPSGEKYWLEWATDVDVVQGPVADVNEFRYYYTGDGLPKKTNYALATTSGAGTRPYPDAWLYMGVPAPTTAPTLVPSQAVKKIDITNAGSGYSSAPTVSFSGGAGTGATATAKINAKINTITVTAGGSGYTTPPTIVFSGGEGSDVTASATLNATVTAINLTNGGTGYSSAPTVVFSGGGGSGATATATISAGAVTAITITNAGTGYTSPPEITFSGGSGSGAAATAVVTGAVASITITSEGSGYTSAPTITFKDGGGSGATATATISGFISSITLSSGGSGYSTAPTVTLTGGGGSGAVATAGFEPVETRAYVYTNVSTFGSVKEESGPSPAATVTVTNTGATVTVSAFSAAPTTGYNITHRRIYRTITGASTVIYSFVAEIPVATSSYVDNKLVTELGSELPSLFWEPPPNDLKGLVAMPNGILAGFKGNQVWFSEPYYPHAWPAQYMLTVDFNIVGLGVYQQTLVVLTTSFPYLISGVSPISMSQQKLPIPQPCVSKKSIASDQYGVLYASPNGLVSLGSGTQDVVTMPLYTRDEWQELNPHTLVGMIYNNMYLGFYTQVTTTRALVLSRGDIPPLVELDFPARSVFVDRSTADIFAISNIDNNVYQLDASEINFTTYEWLSKKFALPNPMNFAALKVSANFAFMGDLDAYNAYVDEIKAINAELFLDYAGNVEGQLNTNYINELSFNGSLLLDIPEEGTTRYITVIVYADGDQIFTADVLSPEPLRMPATEKAYVYEIRVSGNTPVRMVAIASSIGELRMLNP